MSLFSDMVQRPGKNKILSVQFYNILSTYNAKIINILYIFLHFWQPQLITLAVQTTVYYKKEKKVK
jgi:hypothetical protein